MLLETASPATIVPPIFPDPMENSPAGGTVSMTVTTDKSVILSGSGPGWYTKNSTLYMKPEGTQPLPLWYNFIFEMASPQYKLLGAWIYPADIPEDAKATLLYPVSADGTVTLNLAHNLAAGSTEVSYMLGIGFSDGIIRTWIPDPTITFEPQT